MQITVSLKLIVSSLEIINFFRHGAKPPVGHNILIIEDSRSHSDYTTFARTPLDK